MRSFLITLVALLVAGLAFADVPVPPLKARVTDITVTLSAQQRSDIEQKLAAFEARKGAQIGVLVLPTTKPETIEQYAVRVQETWKLGRKGVDDGVLMIVAKDDRRLRIEVGYGLEGVLPDAIAKRIIEDDITPQFRGGNFYAGINAGVDRIMNVIDGEPLPPPRRAATSQAKSRASSHLDWLFPAFIVLLVGRRLANAMFGRFVGSGLTGGIVGVLIWLFAGSLLVAVVVGTLAALFGMFSGVPTGRMSRGLGHGWSSGGFGGGGGMSGGGGASGGW